MISSSQVFATLLLVFSATCFAQLLSLRGPLQDRPLALSAHDGVPAVEHFRFLPPVQSTHGDPAENLELLDICVLASVDGKLHALNRTSGHVLWSMSSSSASSSPPEAFSPLVRTQHVEYDPFSGESEHRERYIIEPQTGDIYVLPTPDAPLHRLPYSMSQLVDMSPFSFSDDNRVFVGKKETSLLVIELETGRVKRTVNSECPWDPFEDEDTTANKFELDLDELDGTKPMKDTPVSTEVLIGRTDYHVSIYTKAPRPSQKLPVQSLSFSTYGPNNQDQFIQTNYRKTQDDIYVQPLPTGEILSFRTSQPSGRSSDSWSEADSQPIWGISFGKPIVAVFDILRSATRQHPLVLLQPRPRLQELLPRLDVHSPSNWLSNIDSTYVGIVEENGALFAMSPDQYPLVVFQSKSPTYAGRRTIDPSLDAEVIDLPVEVDAISKVMKMRKLCRENPWNPKCLTGIRPLGESSTDRSRRLLEAEPHSWTTDSTSPQETSETNGSGKPSSSEGTRKPNTWSSSDRSRTLSGLVVAFVLFLAGYGYQYSTNTERSAKGSASIEAQSIDARTRLMEESPRVDLPDVNGAVAAKGPSINPLQPVPLSSDPVSPSKNLNELAAQTNGEVVDDPDGEDESEREGDPATSGKRRPTRRRRRGRKGRGKEPTLLADELRKLDAETEGFPLTPLPTPPISFIPSTSPTSPSSSLVVHDEVLGFGSHGTVVYRGSLQGRSVAVKRLLQDFVTLASREVDILQESDDHPNVIRYYYQEAHANFLYIALELCPASLADIIERPDQFREISNSFDPKRSLVQITSGLRHLHALKVIHRDIKPQNILISSAKKGAGSAAGHRMLISDFGLCRKLEFDQTSFYPTAHGAMGAGTVGWRAPEILRGEVKLDESAMDDQSLSSKGSVGTVVNGSIANKGTRLTKSVDIFALGCLFYYTLTSGGHPYGDRFEREINIMKDAKDLKGLVSFGEEGLEADDLITSMLRPEASERPDTTSCLLHPFFWTPARRLTFLQDASDRFEIMCRDPREQGLIELETDAFNVVGNDWHSRLDKTFIDNLGKFRKYDGRSVQDLMRALRNKKHHYQDLPDNVKRHLGPLPEGFLAYFTRRFPHLFMHVHSVISRSGLRYESMFKSYFQLSE